MDLAYSNSDTARVYKEIVWSIMQEAGKPNLGDYFAILKKVKIQGIRQRMTIYFGKILDLFDGIVNQRLQFRKSPSSIASDDVLDNLLNISEENSREIDKSHILHLLLVSTSYDTITILWSLISFF